MPTTCNYYVTLRCNQRCIFCNIPHTNNGTPRAGADPGAGDANLRDLKRLGVKVLDVTGGSRCSTATWCRCWRSRRACMHDHRHHQRDAVPAACQGAEGEGDALLSSIDRLHARPSSTTGIRARSRSTWCSRPSEVARQLKQPLTSRTWCSNVRSAHVDEDDSLRQPEGHSGLLNPSSRSSATKGCVRRRRAGCSKYFGRPG